MNNRSDIDMPSADVLMAEGAFMAKFREQHEAQKRERPFAEYEPAYKLAYQLAEQPENRGKSWDDIEETAQQQWHEQYHITGSDMWDEMKESVHEGWNALQGFSYNKEQPHYEVPSKRNK